jgi:uncharacterized protein (TIGR02646 family)
MKYCATLAADPPGLADFRAENPHEANWATFRNEYQTAYKELADALEYSQRGLCAFCETSLITNILTPARQIEHWRPKFNGGDPTHGLTFDVANLHASCLGGSKTHLAPPYGPLGLGAGDHLSCGQKKGEQDPDAIPLPGRPYRPTELPVSPPAFSVDIDGTIRPNNTVVAAGLSFARLQVTIDFLGLDCGRLKVARERVRLYLDEQLASYEAEETDPDPINAMQNALARLATDLCVTPGTRLPDFVSVLRDFFGPVHEAAFLPDPGWAVG